MEDKETELTRILGLPISLEDSIYAKDGSLQELNKGVWESFSATFRGPVNPDQQKRLKELLNGREQLTILNDFVVVNESLTPDGETHIRFFYKIN